MGKRQVRVILIPKWASWALLLIVSAVLAALVYYLSGRAYATESYPLGDFVSSLLRKRERTLSWETLLASITPVIADILVFMPWGFLLFVAIDAPERPRLRTYSLTILGGLIFALLLDVWQIWLPTRVTDWLDALANACGALGGAVAGHLRKEIHIQFEH